jgi:ferredoxin
MTRNRSDKQQNSPENGWTIEFDREKCSLCEVCARHCPTGAIRLERKGDTFALYFKQHACNGCAGKTSCEAICPEEAIKVSKLTKPAGRRKEVLLIQSKLRRCSRCNEYFSPDIKLASLGKKGLHHDVEKSLCPLCRRKKLVVNLIDEKMVPGGHAEYRSTKDIIRTSKRKPDQENDKS